MQTIYPDFYAAPTVLDAQTYLGLFDRHRTVLLGRIRWDSLARAHTFTGAATWPTFTAATLRDIATLIDGLQPGWTAYEKIHETPAKKPPHPSPRPDRAAREAAPPPTTDITETGDGPPAVATASHNTHHENAPNA